MLKIIFTLALLPALAVFAEPPQKLALSEKLPLPHELQGEELPWIAAFETKGSDGTYKKAITMNDIKALAAQKKYRKVVFSFFATWCANCQEGLKKMNQNAEELKKNGVLVVLVNVAEKDLENYSRKKIDEWGRQNGYFNDDWLLVFDKFSVSLEKFGLHKSKGEAPLPRTLIADNKLRPLTLIGGEGDDYLQILHE